MAFSPILAIIVVLSSYILVDAVNPLLAEIAIFLYFLFAYVNLEGSSNLATFYLISMVFVIAVSVARSKFSLQTKNTLPSFLVGKLRIPIVSIGLGIGIYLIMRLLQSSTPGSIIGVPSLAINSPAFGVTTIMLLGIVENKLFFTVFNLLKDNARFLFSFPIIGSLLVFVAPIVPFFAVALLFAIFHIT